MYGGNSIIRPVSGIFLQHLVCLQFRISSISMLINILFLTALYSFVSCYNIEYWACKCNSSRSSIPLHTSCDTKLDRDNVPRLSFRHIFSSCGLTSPGHLHLSFALNPFAAAWHIFWFPKIGAGIIVYEWYKSRMYAWSTATSYIYRSRCMPHRSRHVYPVQVRGRRLVACAVASTASPRWWCWHMANTYKHISWEAGSRYWDH